MKNVIKEFDVLMKKMRNLGFGLAANDLELAHKKALADQKKELIEEFKLFFSKHRDSYVAIANIGIIDDLTAKIDRLPFGDEDKFEIELDKTIESKWIGVVDNKRQR